MKVTPSYTQDYYLVVKLNLSTGSTYTLKFEGVKMPDKGLSESVVKSAFNHVFKTGFPLDNTSGFNLLCTSSGDQAVSIKEMYFEAVARTIQELPS